MATNSDQTEAAARAATGKLGCTLTVLDIIAVIFVLTHVGPIWADFTRLLGI